MTPQDRLVTVREGADDEEVLGLLHKHRIEKVLVVDDNFKLRGMITAKDFQKAKDFPLACKDSSGALRVGAAVGTGLIPTIVSRHWSKRALMLWSSIPRMGISKGVLDRVRESRRSTRTCRLSAAISPQARRPRRWSRPGRMASRSVLARDQSARHAWLPASACRRYRPWLKLPKRSQKGCAADRRRRHSLFG